MNQERIFQVLLGPVITEKATNIRENQGQLTFKVANTATKFEIKTAIEQLYQVEIASVQVVNIKGKQKRFGRFSGRRSDIRKAYVTIKGGQDINMEVEA